MDEAEKELALIKNAVGKIDLDDTEDALTILMELGNHVNLLVAEIAPDDPAWGFVIWSENH